MKWYKIKLTKKQLKIIQENWKLFIQIKGDFYKNISALENKISKETGIKDIEFFCSDGDWCGVGNASRTMALIHREELEK